MTAPDDRRLDLGWTPDGRAFLDRHLRRIGVDQPGDPAAQLQIALLRYHVDVTLAALHDEGVDPLTARRIIERVVYASVPNPAEVLERVRMMRDTEVKIELRPVDLILDGRSIAEQTRDRRP